MTENVKHAERAMAAVRQHTDRNYRTEGVAGLEMDLSDLLAMVRHLCASHSLDFEMLAERSVKAYEGDLETAAPVTEPVPFDLPEGASSPRFDETAEWVADAIVDTLPHDQITDLAGLFERGSQASANKGERADSAMLQLLSETLGRAEAAEEVRDSL